MMPDNKIKNPLFEISSSQSAILVVEDDGPTAKHLTRLLTGFGYNVLATIPSGEEALEQVTRTVPDLILMDVNLAGQLNGIQTAAQIQVRFDVPIIYLTAYSEDKFLQQVKMTAPFGYLLKPVQNQELHATIEMALFRHKLEIELKRESEINAVMAEVSRALISPMSLEDISYQVLEHARHLTDSEFGFVGHIDPRTGNLIFSALTGDIWEGCQVEDRSVVFKEISGLWGWVFENREPLLTNDPAADPYLAGIPAGYAHIERFLSVPAFLDKKLVGQIALANSNRDYVEQDLTVIERLANLYVLAIQRKQAEDALQQAHDELETRVIERTAELAETNESLKKEIAERQRAEAELKTGLEKMRIAYQQTKIYGEKLAQDIAKRQRVEKALRESEEKFRTLLEAAPVSIVILDTEGRMVLVNAKTEEMFGYDRSELLTQPVEMLVAERYQEHHIKHRVHYLIRPETRAMGLGLDLAGQHRDGTSFPIEVGLSFAQTASGPLVMCFIVDITTRKQAEETIRASLREKEVLLKEIHHRVKNNLQIISSLLYLQSRQIEDEPTLDMFIQGQNRVKSMALVHEKLYQSQDLTRIDFAEYIRSLTGYLFQSYDANTRGVHLNIAIDHIFLGVDTAIPCGLIINELVSNALKYAFPSPGEAERELPPGEISIQLQVGADNRLTLTVKDNGIGFPPELDFQNTESLGLQLVNNLVNQLDGTIEFKRNNGTIFRVLFTIPAYQQMD